MTLCGPFDENCGVYLPTERHSSAQRDVYQRVMYSKEIVYSWSSSQVLDGSITAYEGAVKLDIPEDTRGWTLKNESFPERHCSLLHKANVSCIHGMKVEFHSN